MADSGEVVFATVCIVGVAWPSQIYPMYVRAEAADASSDPSDGFVSARYARRSCPLLGLMLITIRRIGAMVLAHSIRDHGSSTKLVCLVTPESISNSTIDDIKVRAHTAPLGIAGARASTSPFFIFMLTKPRRSTMRSSPSPASSTAPPSASNSSTVRTCPRSSQKSTSGASHSTRASYTLTLTLLF